jgi:osmotically-inducible protein OsmY
MSSDDNLQESVLAELRWDPRVHAARIGVVARAGVVTLTGLAGPRSVPGIPFRFRTEVFP